VQSGFLDRAAKPQDYTFILAAQNENVLPHIFYIGRDMHRQACAALAQGSPQRKAFMRRIISANYRAAPQCPRRRMRNVGKKQSFRFAPNKPRSISKSRGRISIRRA
jgi:hypothetical protein